MAACVESAALTVEDAAATETTLDPRTPAEWGELRAEAHRMLEDTLAAMENLRDDPCWQEMPREMHAEMAAATLPMDGSPLEAIYDDFVTQIVPYTSANRNPRAWGWVRGQGTPVAMLADMLAAGLNAHVGGSATAPVAVEETVLRWLAGALGFPANASGILTSGATMANLLGVAVARHAMAGFDVREEGLSGRPRMMVYCSDEVHGWAAKSMELLGMGRRTLRRIASDDDFRMDTVALEAQIEKDRADGLQPIAVIATAGTVNTGSFDDLRAVRAVCDRHGVWMHVDGAYGALLKLAPEYADIVDGLELADSLAFDPHKWMGMPFETGCLLVRDREAHEAAFKSEAAYMERAERGMMADGWSSFADRGIEGSRGFKALRVWMQLRTLGLRRHGDVIAMNVRQAAYLAARVVDDPSLELLAPRAANVVCFGYGTQADSSSLAERNAVNREIVLRLQESGRFVVSGTTLRGGVYALRAAIVNHRTRQEDLAELVDAVIAHGDALREALPNVN